MKRAIWLTIFIFMLTAQAVHAADDAIHITGELNKPGDWTVDKLKTDLAADVTSITYAGRDAKHTSNAVPLVVLLKAAGLQTDVAQSAKGTDPKTKHSELRFAVIVEGRDGYLAVFSLAELMPDLGNRHVYLALDEDGKPLGDTDGPVKMIASDDTKPARWVHGVKTITIVKIQPPTTQH